MTSFPRRELFNSVGFPTMIFKWILFASFCVCLFAFPEQGRWIYEVNQGKRMAGIVKAVYQGTGLYIKVSCESSKNDTEINISYVVRMMTCYQETQEPYKQDFLEELHRSPATYLSTNSDEQDYIVFFKSKMHTHRCDHSIILEPEDDQNLIQHLIVTTPSTSVNSSSISPNSFVNSSIVVPVPLEKRSIEPVIMKRSAEGESELLLEPAKSKPVLSSNDTTEVAVNTNPQFVISKEGIFIITIKVEATRLEDNYSAILELDIKGSSGYLSVVDWPLLPFYGSMCIMYFIYGLVWLIVLALQWRDLLRIQFWIGAVIFLGMIEKAVFYAEYQSVNSTGTSVQGAVLFAELVSCLKRTLARMLVIIVSLGFGIVKPRLGPMLHRVVGVGGLFLLLCSLEAFLRIMRHKNESARTLMLAEVPLAVLDTAICWWIFRNLVQTTRTLRLRRNVIKLSLYRHFTNALIFACIASVAFMVWVYKAHFLPKCVTDWKELWVDDAYWHLLFSVVLLVIMILWRPTNNNQRYAFTPLIDAYDDEDDAVMNGAYDGMKIRLKQQNSGTSTEKEPLKNKMEDDLAWVEENIPSSADTALPRLIDSDEEIMTTKFEMSKME